MSLRLVRSSAGAAGEIRSFNERLRSGGWDSFPLEEWVDGRRGDDEGPISRDSYVAIDQDARVRGGLVLVRQPLWVAGEVVAGVNLQAPLAEGVVDPAHAAVAPIMLKQATRLEPDQFAVGMGGRDQPLPRLLQGLGWMIEDVPFFFRVHRAGRFLEHLPSLRRSPARRLAAAVARFTGMGRVSLPLLFRRRRPARSLSLDTVDVWGGWVDEVWERAAESMTYAVVRSSSTLPTLLPVSSRLLLVRAAEGAQTLGWLAMLDTVMEGNAYFGNLRVGTIVDGLAIPDRIGDLVACGDDFLRERGVDVTLSNQSHPAWIQAFDRAGFRSAPSNYLFAASRHLEERWAAQGGEPALHVTRGDGDGRIHL